MDRSITSHEDFVRADVLGVLTLLVEAGRRHVKKFLQISTISGSFSESDLLDPSSHYSAKKTCGELLARLYSKTYGMNIVVTRSSNNYGPV